MMKSVMIKQLNLITSVSQPDTSIQLLVVGVCFDGDFPAIIFINDKQVVIRIILQMYSIALSISKVTFLGTTFF